MKFLLKVFGKSSSKTFPVGAVSILNRTILLKDISADMKNRILYNSADHTSLLSKFSL